jgi:hypothetical protein
MKTKALASTPLLGLFVSLLVTQPAHAQADQILPPIGGSGGGAFVARCQNGDILTGFELRTADDVDSIRPICARPTASNAIGHRYAYSQKFGGDGGGNTVQLVCPPSTPAIAGITVDANGVDTVVVHSIDLYCSEVVPNQQTSTIPTVQYVGPEYDRDFGQSFKMAETQGQICPKGLMPVGISGRSGIWLDAFGLICGVSPLAGKYVGLGRINTGNDSQQPKRTLCEAARDARARNSPAAPNLEAQCEASKTPVKSLGRVDTGQSAPRPQRSICDSAADARARSSPAAPSLEAQCQAAGGIYKMRPSDYDFELVRAKGEARAAGDPSAANVRSPLYDAPRRGFDIGLGVWADQTAPGPGKTRYRDFLSFAEQQGFDMAAAFALPRNKYAGLVAVGTAINAADAQVRAKRNASKDGFYWLGFDIASGLFGDPRAGSQGSKALGSGAIAIRDSLNAAGQAGFNASMQMHLARKY